MLPWLGSRSKGQPKPLWEVLAQIFPRAQEIVQETSEEEQVATADLQTKLWNPGFDQGARSNDEENYNRRMPS